MREGVSSYKFDVFFSPWHFWLFLFKTLEIKLAMEKVVKI